MDKAGIESWFSPDWLLPQALMAFEWQHPLFLYLLPVLPLFLLFRWLFLSQVRQKLNVSLPEGQSRGSKSAWLRFLPIVFFTLGFTFLMLALARPQMTNEKVERTSEGIDIMLVLDISESMQIEDFVPNRLEAAKAVAREFILGRFQDRIGLVIFSGEAISYSPLTTDYDLLNSLLNDIDFRMIEKGGTAIGLAIGVTINRMKNASSNSKVMILLSDGENTAGSINPITAAQLARERGIKMYTIGVGKEGKVPYGTDMFGRKRYIDQSLDESTLREIARLGEGKFFRATNNQALDEIFSIIDEYEKAEIKESRYQETKDYYFVYLLYAIICLLIWLLLKNTFMVSVLED